MQLDELYYVHDIPEIPGISFEFYYGLKIKVMAEYATKYAIALIEYEDFQETKISEVKFLTEFENCNTYTDENNNVYYDFLYYYYRPYNVGFYKIEDSKIELIYIHKFDLKNKEVLIESPYQSLGDSLALIGYCDLFQKKHNCHLTMTYYPTTYEIIKNQYKNIDFIHEFSVNLDEKHYYARYDLKKASDRLESKLIQYGVNKVHSLILGVDTYPEPKPKLDLSSKRVIKEKYVCIATQATRFKKVWSTPNGWETVIKFLKSIGYRVLCVDRNNPETYDFYKNYIPEGVEDFTGDISLQERINLIKDADFFIGLSSGLSWLAWGCNIPIVLIAGYSAPNNDFYTPYRLTQAPECKCFKCHNLYLESVSFDEMYCINDVTKNRFECEHSIKPYMVIEKIKQLIADHNLL